MHTQPSRTTDELLDPHAGSSATHGEGGLNLWGFWARDRVAATHAFPQNSRKLFCSWPTLKTAVPLAIAAVRYLREQSRVLPGRKKQCGGQAARGAASHSHSKIRLTRLTRHCTHVTNASASTIFSPHA